MTEAKHIPLSQAIINMIRRCSPSINEMQHILEFISEVEIAEDHDQIAAVIEDKFSAHLPKWTRNIDPVKKNLAEQKQRVEKLAHEEEKLQFPALFKSLAKYGNALDMEAQKYFSDEEKYLSDKE